MRIKILMRLKSVASWPNSKAANKRSRRITKGRLTIRERVETLLDKNSLTRRRRRRRAEYDDDGELKDFQPANLPWLRAN